MAAAQKVNDDQIPMTREGYDLLKKELISLRTEGRSEISRKLEEARAFGDLSENAEFHAAQEEQAQLETRILWLETRLSKAKIVDMADVDASKVALGTTVTILDLDTQARYSYVIVSSEESDPKENRISASSPVGKALMNKEVGAEVPVRVPRGTRKLRVLNICVDTPSA
jgi:transcription elongation factor GreA